jgi:hypothetical protein
MKFKRKELAKLFSKMKLWNVMGWIHFNSLNRIKRYSSLNCGKTYCACESNKQMQKHLRNKRERFKNHLIRKDLNYEEKITKEPKG